MPPTPVALVKARTADAPLTLKGVGHVTPITEIVARPQVTAIIVQRHFKDGAAVKGGEPLFSLDTSMFRKELARAQADVGVSRAAADVAAKEALRYQKLLGTGDTTPEMSEAKNAEAKEAISKLHLTEADVAIAKENLGYCAIGTPITGRVGRCLLDVGNLAVAAESELVVIRQMQPIRVTFSLPGRYMAEVRSYMSKAKLKAVATRPDGKGRYEGVLTFLGTHVNPETGMVDLEARFPNAKEGLWPGEFVEVTLTLTIVKGCTLLPWETVQQGATGHFVYMVEKGKAVMRPVVTGRRVGLDVVIEKGLKPGEAVVSRGQGFLYPNASVFLSDAKAPTPKKPAAAKGPKGTSSASKSK